MGGIIFRKIYIPCSIMQRFYTDKIIRIYQNDVFISKKKYLLWHTILWRNMIINLFSGMGLWTLHKHCLSRSKDFLQLKLESCSRLLIPQFYGTHCTFIKIWNMCMILVELRVQYNKENSLEGEVKVIIAKGFLIFLDGFMGWTKE